MGANIRPAAFLAVVPPPAVGTDGRNAVFASCLDPAVEAQLASKLDPAVQADVRPTSRVFLDGIGLCANLLLSLFGGCSGFGC